MFTLKLGGLGRRQPTIHEDAQLIQTVNTQHIVNMVGEGAELIQGVFVAKHERGVDKKLFGDRMLEAKIGNKRKASEISILPSHAPLDRPATADSTVGMRKN